MRRPPVTCSERRLPPPACVCARPEDDSSNHPLLPGYQSGVIDTASSALRIAVVGPSRFGIGEPYAGGLEAHTAGLVRSLHERGHRLRVFAGPEGETHHLPVTITPVVARTFDRQFTGRRDTSHPVGFCRHESQRYQGILDGLRQRPDVDIVHNNSLHPAVVDGDPGDGSFVHVLHCPPFPKLAAAHRRLLERSRQRHVIAVSDALSSLWGGIATDVIGNGIDLDTWADPGLGHRTGAVWAGRLVEEKAPHLAIRAARLAGLPIRLAGPVGDSVYFDRFVRPELGVDAVWLGALAATELAVVFRSARVGVVSPMWDEPFCLVAAEMLASGTPVATFDRGGLAEFVRPHVGALAVPGDAASLADAVRLAAGIQPSVCAEFARRHLSSGAMVDRYETVYERAVRHRVEGADDSGRRSRATA